MDTSTLFDMIPRKKTLNLRATSFNELRFMTFNTGKVNTGWKSQQPASYISGSWLLSHLNVMQDLAKNGALFPAIAFGPVFIAVCGQSLQALTQRVAILILKLLGTHLVFPYILTNYCKYSNQANTILTRSNTQQSAYATVNRLFWFVSFVFMWKFC